MQKVTEILVDAEKSLVESIIQLERKKEELRVKAQKEQDDMSRSIQELQNELEKTRVALVAIGGKEKSSSRSKTTIKEMILEVLELYLLEGLPAIDILRLVNQRFEEELPKPLLRTSLSPQLSRLKVDDKIELVGKNWKIKVHPKKEPSVIGPDDPVNISESGFGFSEDLTSSSSSDLQTSILSTSRNEKGDASCGK